jgi:hypothetical protein
MACVKPLDQFNFEAERYPEQELPPAPASDEGVICFPLEMEWVSGPAYMWAWGAALLVWVGAFATVTFAFCFYHRADWWKNGVFSDFWQHVANTLVVVIIILVIAFGVYADSKAMSYCIVPWVQNVERTMMIPFYGQATCKQFQYFSLLCTMSQIMTIQLNAWVLANTVRNSSCQTEKTWEWLWVQGGFGFCPLNLVHSVLLLWGLSTLQFIVPSLFALANISPWQAPNQIKKKVDLHRPLDKQSYKLHNTRSVLAGSVTEGVTLMALASGMRYTGAVSLSYPVAMIKRIKHGQIGFRIKTGPEGSEVWDQTQHGWQFRCVKELEKLYAVQVKRLWFILVVKYGGQMNVQVTLFIIRGTLQSMGSKVHFNYFGAAVELLSLGTER